MKRPATIAAVVPAFQPEPKRFRKMLAALAPQCEAIFIVDNGGARQIVSDVSPTPCAAVEIIGHGKNLGVATAQNLGIRRALDLAADAILFMDQDSVPHPGMVRHLVSALDVLECQGRRVAACGPRYHGPAAHDFSSFVRAGRLRLKYVLPLGTDPTVACDFLISSGMLVPSDTLRAVGEMEDALFIDHVDTEWCFRAKRGGYECHGVAAAHMEHELGRSRKRIWLGRWRQVPDHPPERMYYLARNTLWLSRRDYISLACKQHLLTRLAGLVTFALLARRDRRRMLLHFGRGMCRGLCGPVKMESNAQD